MLKKKLCDNCLKEQQLYDYQWHGWLMAYRILIGFGIAILIGKTIQLFSMDDFTAPSPASKSDSSNTTNLGLDHEWRMSMGLDSGTPEKLTAREMVTVLDLNGDGKVDEVEARICDLAISSYLAEHHVDCKRVEKHFKRHFRTLSGSPVFHDRRKVAEIKRLAASDEAVDDPLGESELRKLALKAVADSLQEVEKEAESRIKKRNALLGTLVASGVTAGLTWLTQYYSDKC